MMRTFNIENGTINKTILVITSLLLIISISYAESRVIVEGNSSIIIDSQMKNSRLLADNIETKLGGKFIDTGYDDNSIYDLKDSAQGLPISFVIEDAYPNPFNPSTNIKYGIEKTSDIEISIYDLTGSLVNNLRINDQPAGWHEFTWRGTDSFDHNVSSGIYLVTMRVGENIQKQKVTYLR